VNVADLDVNRAASGPGDEPGCGSFHAPGTAIEPVDSRFAAANWNGVTQVRGGGGGGDGPRAFISPQACSRIRLDRARLRLTINRSSVNDFSYSAFALRTIVASVSDNESAAVFGARMTGAGGSRDVSDPTRGPRTLTPGSVRGSLTSQLLVMETTRN
jgi:hypothetical protein